MPKTTQAALNRAASAVRRRARLIAGVAGCILLLLAVAQVVLPRIAAGELRQRLGRDGQVESVAVHAFPAVKLLWGAPDSVNVRMGAFNAGPAEAARLLRDARGVDRVSIVVRSAAVGPLQLRDAVVSKKDQTVVTSGQVGVPDGSAITAALPFAPRLMSHLPGRVPPVIGRIVTMELFQGAVAVDRLAVHQVGPRRLAYYVAARFTT